MVDELTWKKRFSSTGRENHRSRGVDSTLYTPAKDLISGCATHKKLSLSISL